MNKFAQNKAKLKAYTISNGVVTQIIGVQLIGMGTRIGALVGLMCLLASFNMFLFVCRRSLHKRKFYLRKKLLNSIQA